MSDKYEATIHPQYDQNGGDSGLWIVFDTSLGYETPVYENVTLFIRRDGKLHVGQFPDWDNESYDEDGYIDAEHVELGAIECANPYQDDEAAGVLLGFLENSRDAVNII